MAKIGSRIGQKIGQKIGEICLKLDILANKGDSCFTVTILCRIIIRMKFLFSNKLGDYSYSFQGFSELTSVTVTVSLFFYEKAVTGNNSPLKNFLQLQLHDSIVFELEM